MLWLVPPRSNIRIPQSSTEVYRSLSSASTKVIWIQSLIQELRIPLFQEPLLWCDNLSTIALTANAVFHADQNILN